MLWKALLAEKKSLFFFFNFFFDTGANNILICTDVYNSEPLNIFWDPLQEGEAVAQSAEHSSLARKARVRGSPAKHRRVS